MVATRSIEGVKETERAINPPNPHECRPVVVLIFLFLFLLDTFGVASNAQSN